MQPLQGKFTLIAGLFAALLSGITVAVQSKVNGVLGSQLDDSILTAFLSFGSGWVVCLILFLGSKTHAQESLRRLVRDLQAGDLPWWALIGGWAGAFLVFFQSSLVNIVGLAGFTIAIVAGTTVGGVLMDALGVSGITRKLNVLRGIGAMITLTSVVLMVSGRLEGNSEWLLLVLPFLTGIMTTFQQATLGLVRHTTHSFILATLVSFTAGTLLLGAVWLMLLPSQGLPAHWPSDPLLYTGGLLGLFFIVMISLIVRRIGVLLLTMTMTAGQLVTSLVIDLWFPDAYPITTLSYIALVLAMFGVAIAAVGLRSSRVKVPGEVNQML